MPLRIIQTAKLSFCYTIKRLSFIETYRQTVMIISTLEIILIMNIYNLFSHFSCLLLDTLRKSIKFSAPKSMHHITLLTIDTIDKCVV